MSAHDRADFGGVTAGMVCAHHHLYSALARGMPAPPGDPGSFREILENVWWRLDRALDLEMIEWSAKLGALEALEAGCTAIVDHHESPNAIEGSLTTIADACAEVGVRIDTCYGVTDRHGADGARRGLEENDRYLASLAARGDGARGRVGVHAAFTCTDDTLAAAAELATRHGVGVHVHVAEGVDDLGAAERLRDLSRDDWLLVHGVYLPDDHGLRGTIVHNPRSNMNNGTDGIGATMLAEFGLAYVKHREADVHAGPDTAWSWLAYGWTLFPDARRDRVVWSYEPIEPWHVAFTTNIRAIDVDVGGEAALRAGVPTRVDAAEIRAKAREQAARLHARLEEMP